MTERFRATIVAALIALVLLGSGVVVAVLFAPPDSATDPAPVITTLFGLIATVVVPLIALLKVEGMEQKIDKITNGDMEETVRRAVRAVQAQRRRSDPILPEETGEYDAR